MDRFLKVILVLITGVMLSFYFHPTFFAVIPTTNTKLLLAVWGGVMLVYRTIVTKDYTFSRGLIYALMIAGIFALVNNISIMINNSEDYSYTSYPMSALVWIFGAYGALTFVRWTHGKITIELVVRYLAAGAAFHGILSQVIERNDAVRNLVNTLFILNTWDMEEMGRLYSIGVGLDPSGIRFAVILIMIAGVLTLNKIVKRDTGLIVFYLVCFAIISVLGNIISRTTIVGMGLGIGIFVLSTGLYRFVIKVSRLRLMRVLGLVLALGIPLVVFYYNNNSSFREQIEYGFEGFFSLVESGEFQTGSTDELASMWVWPEDTKTWIIGSGDFGATATGSYFSDIGYCRFIFYSGLIGISVFGIFFIYNSVYFAQRYPRYRYIFLLMIVVTFVIWTKVATDIFQLFALFYAFTDEEELNASLDEREEEEPLELASI